MKAWAVTAPNAPLEQLEMETPQPESSEVVVRVTHCGVCHSDLHFWKGEYNLGGGKVMKLADRGVKLPRCPGHEIVGEVVALGPDAQGVAIGDRRIVYPWIGCGTCDACKAEHDNLCTAQRSLGVVQHGGFASHVKVPHPRYLVDPGNIDPALAATYACSGITAYSAIRKVLPLAPEQPVVLIGAGGLGLTAIAMLRAFGHRAIISVDVSDEKLAAATAEGASAVVNSSGEGSLERLLEVTGGPVPAVIDFVNISPTARMGFDALSKGGRLVVVGVSGGEITLSLAGLVFKANSILGALTGSIQDLRDVVEMANKGLLPPTPVATLAKDKVNEAMVALREGNVTGRLVLEDL
ncbi:alcohol dehydrogenase (plasmid) [Novosphingobium resinovorum]|uniref:alcohol dehydrogenase n=1 Tax=Novosphingobium TaxID=165696 RepID=UPI001B3C6BAD|nr:MULTISPECIES: alcohol dehydrogenase [Novosphingobium]MBF7015340.1 alcohol dehydrogenase catalytic domain-containing protein [Novosphingobium sp. HR1a]WJM30017.1 alcohol dehydrogenase [Novosphingobium resinovorum]